MIVHICFNTPLRSYDDWTKKIQRTARTPIAETLLSQISFACSRIAATARTSVALAVNVVALRYTPHGTAIVVQMSQPRLADSQLHTLLIRIVTST